ncbi:thioredoxin family protein [candidate division KSB1 bacterium]|nr:thioredoxin family protein [candidate division KSB1 bacterium]
MAETPSTMLELGTSLPSFELKEPDGRTVSNRDFKGQPLLIMFICNHCPFVKHIQQELSRLTREFVKKGIPAVAINSNDIQAYPQDGPEQMKKTAQDLNYPFPYVLDPDQSVAKAFRAACTPDFYLFDAEHRLVYRGQFDDSRPGNSVSVTGKDLRLAMERLIDELPPIAEQMPSMGCNIKWKPGNVPNYF